MNGNIGVGVLGIGGYGQQHLSTIGTLQEAGICRLAAVADPLAARHAGTVAALRSAGVEVYNDAERLLRRDDVQAVFIATPIHLHAPQTVMALQAGKHVYLEKPPCATLRELERMEAAQQQSGTLCAVGFQMQTHPALRFLKRQLVQGAIGQVRRVWSSVRWRRTDAYYNRSLWAGCFRVGGQPVFDGPATNALAHVVHAALFLAGARESEWANIRRVRGALLRARPIESYDTIYLEAATAEGVPVQLAFTHASPVEDEIVLRCAGDEGVAELNWEGSVTLALRGQTPQLHRFFHQSAVASTLNFLQAVRAADAPDAVAASSDSASSDSASGAAASSVDASSVDASSDSATAGARLATRLSDTRPFLQMVNGALQSSCGIHSFAAAQIERVATDESHGYYQVAGLDGDMKAFGNGLASSLPLLDKRCGRWLDVAQLAPGLSSAAPTAQPDDGQGEMSR